MSISELHKKFVELGGNARHWINECKILLPDIQRQRVWAHEGYSSIYEYAAKLAGLSRGQVDDALWIMKRAQGKPELIELARAKGVGSIRPVVSVATEESSAFWAKKAENMPRRVLRQYVRDHKRALFATGSAVDFRAGPKEEEVTMNLDPKIAAKLKHLARGDWNKLMAELLEAREQQLAATKPEKVVTNSRHIPASIRRFVESRALGGCEFPSCGCIIENLHHVDRFSLKKEHDPDRIFALCKPHHDLMHQDLIKNDDLGPDFWKVREAADYMDIKILVDQEVQRRKLAYQRAGP